MCTLYGKEYYRVKKSKDEGVLFDPRGIIRTLPPK